MKDLSIRIDLFLNEYLHFLHPPISTDLHRNLIPLKTRGQKKFLWSTPFFGEWFFKSEEEKSGVRNTSKVGSFELDFGIERLEGCIEPLMKKCRMAPF